MFNVNELLEKLVDYGYDVRLQENKIVLGPHDINGLVPCIRLDELQRYEIDEAFAKCVKVYETGIPDELKDIPNKIMDPSGAWIKSSVLPILMSTKKAEAKGYYYEPAFCDLCLVFYVGDAELGYNIKITQDCAEGLKLSNLSQIALNNLKCQTESLPLSALLGIPSMFGDMTVITTHNRCYGASAILFEKDSLPNGTILLPSSVHEVLAIDPIDGVETSILLDLVHSINASSVLPDDQLSDNVYVVEDGEIRIA